MTTFQYTAKDERGLTKTGTVDADSIDSARQVIASKGYIASEVFEAIPISLYSQSNDMDWSLGPKIANPVAPTESAPSVAVETAPRTYFPLLETLRLYAGWLLAWYCMVYAIGSYQYTRELPFTLPYAESLFLSPLVLSFTFAAYLFLLLTGMYKWSGRKRSAGFVLLLAGIALFLLYRMNVG